MCLLISQVCPQKPNGFEHTCVYLFANSAPRNQTDLSIHTYLPILPPETKRKYIRLKCAKRKLPSTKNAEILFMSHLPISVREFKQNEKTK